jgi:hypothetical protein
MEGGQLPADAVDGGLRRQPVRELCAQATLTPAATVPLSWFADTWCVAMMLARLAMKAALYGALGPCPSWVLAQRPANGDPGDAGLVLDLGAGPGERLPRLKGIRSSRHL